MFEVMIPFYLLRKKQFNLPCQVQNNVSYSMLNSLDHYNFTLCIRHTQKNNFLLSKINKITLYYMIILIPSSGWII